ncbi:MAG: hypothetical protein QM770_05215 [Tepidisphaeraceae bacterium]
MTPADDSFEEEDDDLPFEPEPSSDEDAAFPPPPQPTEVHCLHCGRTFMSNEMMLRWQDFASEFAWCCATEDCDGVGFCFDVWPTDPDWRDADGHAPDCDALPVNFPEKRADCVWIEGDDELLYDDADDAAYTRGRREQTHFFQDMPTLWKPGTEPKPPGDDSDIPF